MKTPLSPLESVLRAFTLHAHRTAVQDGALHLTYAELADRSARLAALLRAQGLHPGGHVLVISANTAAALTAFHAVPLAGGVIVPLNPDFTDDALNFLTRHADPQVALVAPDHRPRVQRTLQAQGIPVLPLQDHTLGRLLASVTPLPLALPEGLSEDAPISVNYTSGTTSDPKGVMLTHRSAFINQVNMLYHLNLRPSSAYLHALPLAHGNGWGCAWAVTAAGGRHVMLPTASSLRAALRGGVTHLCASPAILSPLTDPAVAAPLAHPVRVLLAGTAPQSRVIASLRAQGFEVLHGYGLTETSAVLTINDLTDAPAPQDAQHLTRQGHPMLCGGQVQVVSEDHRPVPHDGQTPGEIVIRSNQVMRGYYKNPRATRRVIQGGWLHTGDLAVVHPDGQLDILDREGDLLRVAGQPISSVQIEAVLYRHPSVREAVVVGVPGADGDQPVAFVTLHPGAQVQGRELLAFCAPHLPPFARPHHLQIEAQLPKTASGKVLKYALRAQAREKLPLPAAD